MASFPTNKRSRTYSTSKNNWVEDLVSPVTKFNNLIDPSTWVVGSTGSQPGFPQYGATERSSIIEGYGPVGKKIPLWQCTPWAGSVADGGLYSDYKTIDPSKAYRMAACMRKTGTIDGVQYFGLWAQGADVKRIDTGAESTNPYYWVGDSLEADDWVLVVGYLFGHAYAGTTILGGGYRLADGGLMTGSSRLSFKMQAATTDIYLRVFLNSNNTDLDNRLYLTKPRFDLIDGTEPPLALILAHTATFTSDYSETIITGSDGSENTMYVQTTMPAMAIGDYWIDYSSGENRVFYREEGRIVELQPYFETGDPLAPSGVTFEDVQPQYRSEALSGKRQIRTSAPQRYSATLSFPPQKREEFKPIDSFLSLMQNTASSFYLSIPNIGESDGWLNGTPRIKGAGQSGNSIVTDGWWYRDGILMIANGDWLKIEGSDKLYRVTADCYATTTYEITIPITPKLQFVPADNAGIIFVNPEMKVDLINVHKFAVKPPELYSYEIDVQEVIE